MMEALTRVTASATEWRRRMVRRTFRFSHHREQGGDRCGQPAERPTSRRWLRKRPSHEIKSMGVHDDPLLLD
jgi:hypothetical protein